MKNKFLLLLMMGITLFAACSDDDEPEIPPTLNEVIGEYTGEKLNATVNGTAAGENATAQIVKKEDNTTSIMLLNVISGFSSFEIPNATFEAVSRSSYYSQITGQIADNISGLNVQANATIDEGVMTLTVTTAEIAGTPANAESFYDKTFKGEMIISLEGMSTPMEQRVYLLAPTNEEATNIRLRIENFSFSGLPLGNIELDNIPFVQRGDVYGFSIKDQSLDMPALGALGVSEVSLDARGAILEGKTLQLTLQVDAPPFLVDVTFEGDTVQESTNTLASFAVEGNAVLTQPAISENDPRTYIMYLDESAATENLNLTPTVTLPEGAVLDSIIAYYNDGTFEHISEEATIDFSKVTGEGCVKYFVTGQDIREHGETVLKAEMLTAFRDSYTMTEWVDDSYMESSYKEPLYMATSNPAAAMFKIASSMIEGLTVEPFPVTQDGDAAKIITRDTKGGYAFIAVVPKVTAGTLFNGAFELNATETLKSTKFGQPFLKGIAPTSFTFTYKYTPGATYYNTIISGSGFQTSVSSEEVPDKTDQCSIAAYLYEVADYSESLDGTNINTSEKVIMKAVFNGDKQDSFTTKTINFEETGNGTFDPSKKYKMAVVFTPSKDGDQYAGAPESTLWIQSFEVTY